MSQFPVFLINLDRSIERRKVSHKQLTHLNLGYTRIKAVSSEDLLDEPSPLWNQTRALRRFQRKMTGGEIACSLSHQIALKAFVETDYQYCLILEDDALLHPSTSACVEATSQHLLRKFSNEWLVLNVCREPKLAASRIADIEVADWIGTLWGSHYHPMGAVGLVWSRKGAFAMLQFSREIYAPYDIMIRDMCAVVGGGFAVSPAPVSFWETPSEIDFGLHRRSSPLRYGRLVSAIQRHTRGIGEKFEAYLRKWKFERKFVRD